MVADGLRLESVRHYDCHGRIQWVLQKVPAAIAKVGGEARPTFAQRLRGALPV